MTDQIPMPPDQFDEIVAIIKANTDGSLMHEVDMFFRPVEYPRAAGETAWFLQHMFNHSHPTLFHAPAKGGLVQYIRGSRLIRHVTQEPAGARANTLTSNQREDTM